MGGVSSNPDKIVQRHEDGTESYKGIKRDKNGQFISCVFCDIVCGIERQQLLYKDELVSIFSPISPSARFHYLVVPNEHIANTDSLHSGHVELLNHMYYAGRKFLSIKADCGEKATRLTEEQNSLVNLATKSVEEPQVPENSLFLFHTPPFNSIDHLHLHCMITPYVSWRKAIQYAPIHPYCELLVSIRDRAKRKIQESIIFSHAEH